MLSDNLMNANPASNGVNTTGLEETIRQLRQSLAEAERERDAAQAKCAEWRKGLTESEAREVLRRIADTTIRLFITRNDITLDEDAATEDEAIEDMVNVLTGDDTGCLDPADLNPMNCERLWLQARFEPDVSNPGQPLLGRLHAQEERVRLLEEENDSLKAKMCILAAEVDAERVLTAKLDAVRDAAHMVIRTHGVYDACTRLLHTRIEALAAAKEPKP